MTRLQCTLSLRLSLHCRKSGKLVTPSLGPAISEMRGTSLAGACMRRTKASALAVAQRCAVVRHLRRVRRHTSLQRCRCRRRRCGLAGPTCRRRSSAPSPPSGSRLTSTACRASTCQRRTQHTRRRSTPSSECWLRSTLRARFKKKSSDARAPPSSHSHRVPNPCVILSLFFFLCRKVVHNINVYPMTDRPGTESYDPVLLGGKNLTDHYPYASVTVKEGNIEPREM